MKCSGFIATSLDGYIARPDGEIDWLPTGDAGEDFGYEAFMATVDMIVMGRATFQKVLSFEEWPYGDKPVMVLSRRGVVIPEHLKSTVESMSLRPAEVVDELAKRGLDHLYIDGGKTIQGFIEAGLIQKLIISRIPVVIGRGLSLFGEVPRDINFRHIATRSFAGGLVQSEYELIARSTY